MPKYLLLQSPNVSCFQKITKNRYGTRANWKMFLENYLSQSPFWPLGAELGRLGSVAILCPVCYIFLYLTKTTTQHIKMAPAQCGCTSERLSTQWWYKALPTPSDSRSLAEVTQIHAIAVHALVWKALVKINVTLPSETLVIPALAPSHARRQ